MSTLKEIENKYGVKIGGVFPGTNPNASYEDVLKEIDKVLQEVVDGQAEEIML